MAARQVPRGRCASSVPRSPAGSFGWRPRSGLSSLIVWHAGGVQRPKRRPLSRKLKPQLAEADLAVRIGSVEGQGIALFPDFYARGLPPVGDAVLSRPLYLTLREDKARVSRVRLISLRKC